MKKQECFREVDQAKRCILYFRARKRWVLTERSLTPMKLLFSMSLFITCTPRILHWVRKVFAICIQFVHTQCNCFYLDGITKMKTM